MTGICFHYTNEKGHKAIRSQRVWLFRASKPTSGHPKGAYFTTLAPGTKNLGKRLFVRGCADKTEFTFCFVDAGDLRRLAGGRGAFVLDSEMDYTVHPERQRFHGPTADYTEVIE